MPIETVSTLKRGEISRAFFKNWHVKLNDPASQRALWLRFSVLSSGNGFKRVAEVWAVYFQKQKNGEVRKTAIKQTYDINAFLASDQSDIRIGNCSLLSDSTQGSIHSKGQSVEWDLKVSKSENSSIHFVPDFLSKTGLVKNSIVTLCEEQVFSGKLTINGEEIVWNNVPGMQGYFDGTKNGHSWVWGHCNAFFDAHGLPSNFLFEGFSTRSQVGPFVIPKLSSFYFLYRDQHYHFNTLRDALYVKSRHDLNEWKFQADRDDLSFRGQIRAEHKDFAGLSFEDTNGSLLYCTHSELATMDIQIYRKGKLETSFTSPGGAGFEIVGREKNPYVPTLL